MSSQPAAGTQANRGNLPKGACYKCGKTGHWSRDCTAPREEWIPQQPRDASAGTAADGAADPEGATGGSAAAGGATGKKKSNRPPKFTVVDHLLGPNGLAYLHGVIPERFDEIKKGPGHEFGDFQRLMGLYREWTRKMYPYKPHEWVMNRVKVLCKTREARAYIRELDERERIELGGEGVDAPEDFTEEDVFFPDQEGGGGDDSDDDDEGEDVVFPDDDEEEEWNEAKHGKKAQLGKKTKGAPAADDSDGEEAIQSQREKDADAFDDARNEVGAGYFDESSDDDDDDGIAVVGATRRESSALGAGEKGKARKKLKEVAAKRRRKKKEPTPEPEEEEAAEEEETAEEGPEPAEAAEASSPKRKQLRRRARDSDEDDEDEEEEEDEEEAGASRRARRRVIKRGIDSDSDSDEPNLRDVIPNDMGGNVLGPSPAKPLVPSFLYDSESDGEKKAEKKGDE